MISLCLFSGQLNSHLPVSTAGRTIMSGWFLITVVLVATYLANLVAALTVTIIPVPFSTLAEMAEQDLYKYGTLGQASFELRFKVMIASYLYMKKVLLCC